MAYPSNSNPATGVASQERLTPASSYSRNTSMGSEIVEENFDRSDSPDRSTPSSITIDQPQIAEEKSRSSWPSDGNKQSSNMSDVSVNNDDEVIKTYLKFTDVTQGWWKAKPMLKNDSDAIRLLDLAIREGNNYFVRKLLDFITDVEQIEQKNSQGQTGLHIAAIVGNKDGAELLVEKRKELLNISDDNAEVPLISAYKKGQLSTFIYLWEATDQERLKSFPPVDDPDSKMLSIGVNLVTNAICMKQYDLALKLANIYPLVMQNGEVLMALTRNFPNKLGPFEALVYPSLKNVQQKIVKTSSLPFYSLLYLHTKAEDTLWAMRRLKNKCFSRLLPEIALILLAPLAVLDPIYQLIRLLILLLFLPFFMLYFLFWKAFAFLVVPIKHIEKKKKEYKVAKEILSLIFVEIKGSVAKSADFYSKSLHEAVSLDVPEVVQQVLDSTPGAIDIQIDKGHNIIQLTVINRSEKVYKLMASKIKGMESYRTMEDSSKNNLLHLVGKVAPSIVSGRITCAALQLQRDLQWREEVKKLIEPRQCTHENSNGETPELVFTREHANLLKEGERWMKTTAESCSITAGLVATILFAAAITVPGGSDGKIGIPLLKKEIAFIIFAASDAISLYSAVMALLVFLSILTAPCAKEDFLVTLPRRLLIGLCLLLLSTTTMIFGFSAIFFLVFCKQRPLMLAPLIGLSCFPIATMVSLQLPLVVDLFQSIYFPILGKQKLH